jgi:putative transcriptional regulator
MMEAVLMTANSAGSIREERAVAMVFAGEGAGEGLYAVRIPEEIDVRAIRGRLGLTQQEFAISFGFSVNTVRHWEQGRRAPEGPARAYLLVIDREPQAVQKALRIA